MPVERGEHRTRRYAPYGSSLGVRHRGPRALARYGPRVASGRKRRAAKNAIVSVPRSKLAFPSGMRTKLRYVQRVEFLNNTQATIAKYAYRANSLTDPSVTGTAGHQPRGFDEFMNVYRTYTVTGSKISVNFCYNGYDGPAALDTNTDTFLIKTVDGDAGTASGGAVAASPPLVVGIHKGVTELAATDTAASSMEQDRTVWRFMTPQDGAQTIGTAMKTSDFFGKDAIVGAEGYTGSITADADNLVYYTVWCARANNTTAGVCMSVGYITIEYDVMFTEPKTLGES